MCPLRSLPCHPMAYNGGIVPISNEPLPKHARDLFTAINGIKDKHQVVRKHKKEAPVRAGHQGRR